MEDVPQQCRVKSVKFEAVGQDRSRLREKKGFAGGIQRSVVTNYPIHQTLSVSVISIISNQQMHDEEEGADCE